MSFLTSHMLHLVIICSIQLARAHSISINWNMKPRLLYGALHLLCNRFGLGGDFYDLQSNNYSQYDRMSSITRVLHTTTWKYFTSHLPTCFNCSPKVVKEAIMTDINDLVQEFWRTSSDGVTGTSFFEMRRLLEILQECFDSLEVCFDIISVLTIAVELTDINI